MTRVVKSGVIGVFTVCVSWLGTAAVVAGEDAAAAPSSKQTATEKTTVTHWVDRSLEYAGELDEEQFVDSAIYLFGHLAWAGQWRRAEPLITNISDQQKRYQEYAMLAFIAAGRGDVAGAVAFAETLDNEPCRFGSESEPRPGCRDNTLFMIALAELPCDDFAGTAKVLNLVHDPRTAFSGWRRLAERQADVGLYEEAAASVAKVAAQDDTQRQDYDQIIKHIAECKATGAKKPLRKDLRGVAYVESLRVMSRWGLMDVNLNDLSEAEKTAAALKETLDRAEAWRRIAWEYCRKNDLERCRNAIQKSLDSAETLPREFRRTVTYISLAELYLELGDRESAKRMAQKAEAAEMSVTELAGGMNDVLTVPWLLSVLVRIGDVEQAVAILEKMQEQEFKTDWAWAAWAAMCAMEGNRNAVDRAIEKAGSDRTKAMICVGVAVGLHEKQRERANKKP
jgi:pentatricopeptide repeat protein